MGPTTLTDHACLSFWYPRLVASGVPTPRTRVVACDIDLFSLIDGTLPDGLDAFLGHLTREAQIVGLPCFLRTGHGSGKHQWQETCAVTDLARLGAHVGALIEWSACVDIAGPGLPVNTWVLREFLDLLPAFTTTWGMPVGRERRYFIEDGRILCHHPYWPPDSVPTRHQHGAKLIRQLNVESPSEVAHLSALSHQVAAHIPGAWSLDWALGRPRPTADAGFYQSNVRWYAIDMAPADRSWHWPDCPHCERFSG